MKRFWSTAQAVERSDGWEVTLDGRVLRLPDGPSLLVPQAALAAAVAAEWQQAGAESGEMQYADVPLTRLAGTAQLRIVPDPGPVAAALAVYGESDLLCYRADTPAALAERQAAAWHPWLEWSRLTLDAPLTATAGVMHLRQHPASIAALQRAAAAQSGWTLAGLGIVVPALGSLVLGLAMAAGVLEAEEALALSRVDERFQAEKWGMDAEAARRQAHIDADVAHAARFMALVR